MKITRKTHHRQTCILRGHLELNLTTLHSITLSLFPLSMERGIFSYLQKALVNSDTCNSSWLLSSNLRYFKTKLETEETNIWVTVPLRITIFNLWFLFNHFLTFFRAPFAGYCKREKRITYHLIRITNAWRAANHHLHGKASVNMHADHW